MLEILKLVLTKKKNKESFSLDRQIQAGMRWLSCAHDATSDGGVSIRYSLFRGWDSSYPEITGYIIPTFLKYYEMAGDSSFKDRAMKMAEWEVFIQQEDGSYVAGAHKEPVGKLVFDTGQIIFGLLKAFQYSQNEKFLEAAIRAGDYSSGQMT